MPKEKTIARWLPLVGLTFAVFVFNTSEFMPIGLLSDIAADLHISEVRAGLLVSVYAWVVALMSLPLMVMVSTVELKRLLLAIIALFVVSHVASALAEGYYTLMLSRIGVACAHSIFWSIAPPLAVRTVPDGRSALGLSTIATGASVAMVVGLPIGRVVGLYVGWRMTFLSIAVISALIFVFIAAVFPRLQSRGKFSFAKIPALLHNRVLLGVFVLALLFATTHYTGYSYIEPFLGQVAGLSPDVVTMVLIVFGASGMLGSIAFSKYYMSGRRRFMFVVTLGPALCLLLMQTATYDIAYTPSVLVKGNAVTLTATLKAGEGKDAVTADGSVELTAVDAHQPAPTGLKALVDAQGKVSLSWTAVAKVDRMTDDFEDYNSWGVDNAGDWSFHDGDKGVTYGYFDDQGLYYDNEKTPFAYIVWTPANYGGEDITVANPTAKPYSGSNAMASVYSYNRKATGELTPLAADNWMISPELTGKAQTVMFRVNNISASNPETYQVFYSTTTAAHDQFQLVAEKTVSNSKWDEVSFELPEGARYFAIRHNTKLEVSPSGIGYSSAPYLFLVDDATFASKGCTFVEYVIYRDGKPLATAATTASEDREAQCDGADHVYQVTARYGDGSESAPVEAVVSMPTGIDIIETTVDAPQGVYSLDGVKQDANARLQRGVYIKNGKKVVVR